MTWNRLAATPWGNDLLRAKRLLLPAVTRRRFEAVLKETESHAPTRQRLVLNSIGAQHFQTRGEGRCDRHGRHTLFGQLWQRLREWSPQQLRLPRGEHAFSVEFEGEGGEDAGGLYRAAMEMAIREVQSRFLPLMVPTPNAQDDCGDNRDCWVLSPSALSATGLRMLHFVGALMGLALRTGGLLPLNWPPHLWRRLVGEERTLDDIRAIDVRTHLVITSIRQDPSLVAGLEWTYPNMAGRMQRLSTSCSGLVTPLDAPDFAEALLNSRLAYDDLAVQALRDGLALIVPIELLQLWTWRELERMVCGEQRFDVAVLQSHTIYTNCQSGDATVQMFWSALEGFSSEERAQFLRFVWGRTRLPLGRDWEQKFQLAMVGPGDDRLPMSHTCFFQLDLPRYSSEEILAERLRLAMNSCMTIDSDGQPRTEINLDEYEFSDEDEEQ